VNRKQVQLRASPARFVASLVALLNYISISDHSAHLFHLLCIIMHPLVIYYA